MYTIKLIKTMMNYTLTFYTFVKYEYYKKKNSSRQLENEFKSAGISKHCCGINWNDC